MPAVGVTELVVLIAVVLIWIAIIAAAILVVRRLVVRSDPAMDALRARLASGEIDEAEYVRLRSVLQGH